MTDEHPNAETLMVFGRSPNETYDVLRRFGCLSPRALAYRMAVVRLLDREREAQIAAGYPPPKPGPTPPLDLQGFRRLWVVAPGSDEGPHHWLSRLLNRALADAGYLDAAGCHAFQALDWAEVVRIAAEIHVAHNRIFQAITPETPTPPPPEPYDGVSTLRIVHHPSPRPEPRTDPITCLECGHPVPRVSVFCGWCGGQLAASRE
jgi:hypothetical protein